MENWEEKIKAFLEIIGKIEQEFKSAKDDFESRKRIDQEKKF